MQGSNDSRIGMARQRKSWDDSSWGAGNGKQNTKARDAKKERERALRRQAQQQREDNDNF